jgi:deoxycytidylate deaminase
MTPCAVCAKLIIASGIVQVVCERPYQNSAESSLIFIKAGVYLDHKNMEVQEYENQD